MMDNTGSLNHFTFACLVSWPLSESEAGFDFVLIQTYLPFICESCSTNWLAKEHHLHMISGKACIKAWAIGKVHFD